MSDKFSDKVVVLAVSKLRAKGTSCQAQVLAKEGSNGNGVGAEGQAGEGRLPRRLQVMAPQTGSDMRASLV